MRRYSVILTLLFFLLYLATAIILEQYLPQYQFPGLLLIPVVFVLLGTVSVALLKRQVGNGVNMVMGLKVFRFLFSLVVVGAYAFFCRGHAIPFVVTYGVFYLAYLLFETWMLLKMNRK